SSLDFNPALCPLAFHSPPSLSAESLDLPLFPFSRSHHPSVPFLLVLFSCLAFFNQGNYFNPCLDDCWLVWRRPGLRLFVGLGGSALNTPGTCWLICLDDSPYGSRR